VLFIFVSNNLHSRTSQSRCAFGTREHSMRFPLVSRLGVSSAWLGHRVCSDHTFGPFVDCRFDFTLFFEQSVFSSLPSLVLIIFAPWVIASLRLDTKKTVPHPIYAAKLVRLLV